MFLKANRNNGTLNLPGAANKNNTLSIITANLHVVGSLVTDGVIQLDGIVDGDVTCEDLTVGESAVINGAVVGNRVRVSGTVNGAISARDVELSRTAKVIGDINHTSLMIEAGAFVQGLCRHMEKADTKPVAGSTESAKPNPVVGEKSIDRAKTAAQPKAVVGGKKG